MRGLSQTPVSVFLGVVNCGIADFIFPKKFPSKLGQAVGVVTTLKNKAAGSEIKDGFGTGQTISILSVKLSMVPWFWKEGCL